MAGTDIETPQLADAGGPEGDSLIELILWASDTSDDLWEIGDRVDALVREGDDRVRRLD